MNRKQAKLVTQSSFAFDNGEYQLADEMLTKVYEALPRLDKDFHKVAILKAQVLRKQNRLSEAKEILDKIGQPYRTAPYWIVLSDILRELKKLQDAMEAAFYATTYKNCPIDAYIMLGICQHDLKQFNDAERSHKFVLSHHPEKFEVWINLGNTLYALHKNKEAEEAYKKGLSINPSFADGWANLGSFYFKEDRIIGSIEAYKNCLTYDRNSAIAHHALGLIALRSADYKNGFRLCEWRWKAVQQEKEYPWPQWQGQPGRLYLISEQGFGDCLMMFRYLEMVRERCDFTLLTHIALHPLIKARYPWIKLSDGLHKIEDFDWYCNTMSLPCVFDTRIETIPNEKWVKEDFLFKKTSKFVIGYCYKGNPTQEQDFQRSISKELFLKIFDGIPNIQTINLTHGDGIEFKDWLETRDKLREINLLITVDTGIAHLAGAMGVPTWILLAKPCYWVYGEEGNAPWYPDFKVFRQEKPYDWKTVVTRVNKELQHAKRL